MSNSPGGGTRFYGIVGLSIVDAADLLFHLQNVNVESTEAKEVVCYQRFTRSDGLIVFEASPSALDCVLEWISKQQREVANRVKLFELFELLENEQN